MKKIVIEGNHLLSGTVHIEGAKNSVVALIPAKNPTPNKDINKIDINILNFFLISLKLSLCNAVITNQSPL